MWITPGSFHPGTATLIIAGLVTVVLALAWRAGGLRAFTRTCATIGALDLLGGVACGWITWFAGGIFILLVAGWLRWLARDEWRRGRGCR